jgi:ubiquinone/menaquinone biosynthesis C-methylase UbiE
MDPFAVRAVRAAYDTVAEDYADAFAGDLDRLPVDRAVLDAAIERWDRSDRRGPVLDVGCGPAQVGDHLARAGVPLIGLDLAPAMLRVAKERATRVSLAAADMRRLPLRTRACAGAVAFYAIQHVPRLAIGDVFAELHRVLVPDGFLVVAAHLGEGDVISTEFLGHAIEPVGGALFAEAELTEALDAGSFVIDDTSYRDPLPHEHQTRRIYLTAQPRPS